MSSSNGCCITVALISGTHNTIQWHHIDAVSESPGGGVCMPLYRLCVDF